MTFVLDREIASLKARWFGVRRRTDVVAFPVDETHIGDIVISLPTARRQSKELGHSLAHEVAVLAAHGALHLIGEEDRTARGRRRMERLVRRAVG